MIENKPKWYHLDLFKLILITSAYCFVGQISNALEALFLNKTIHPLLLVLTSTLGLFLLFALFTVNRSYEAHKEAYVWAREMIGKYDNLVCFLLNKNKEKSNEGEEWKNQ